MHNTIICKYQIQQVRSICTPCTCRKIYMLCEKQFLNIAKKSSTAITVIDRIIWFPVNFWKIKIPYIETIHPIIAINNFIPTREWSDGVENVNTMSPSTNVRSLSSFRPQFGSALMFDRYLGLRVCYQDNSKTYRRIFTKFWPDRSWVNLWRLEVELRSWSNDVKNKSDVEKNQSVTTYSAGKFGPMYLLFAGHDTVPSSLWRGGGIHFTECRLVSY